MSLQEEIVGGKESYYMSSHGADFLSYAVFLLFPVMLCCIKEEAKDDSLATALTAGKHAPVFLFSFFFFFEGGGHEKQEDKKRSKSSRR